MLGWPWSRSNGQRGSRMIIGLTTLVDSWLRRSGVLPTQYSFSPGVGLRRSATRESFHWWIRWLGGFSMESPDQWLTTLAQGSLGLGIRPLLEGHLSTRNPLARYVAHASGHRHLFALPQSRHTWHHRRSTHGPPHVLPTCYAHPYEWTTERDPKGSEDRRSTILRNSDIQRFWCYNAFSLLKQSMSGWLRHRSNGWDSSQVSSNLWPCVTSRLWHSRVLAVVNL
jgi:hypothetical protein